MFFIKICPREVHFFFMILFSCVAVQNAWICLSRISSIVISRRHMWVQRASISRKHEEKYMWQIRVFDVDDSDFFGWNGASFGVDSFVRIRVSSSRMRRLRRSEISSQVRRRIITHILFLDTFSIRSGSISRRRDGTRSRFFSYFLFFWSISISAIFGGQT